MIPQTIKPHNRMLPTASISFKNVSKKYSYSYLIGLCFCIIVFPIHIIIVLYIRYNKNQHSLVAIVLFYSPEFSSGFFSVYKSYHAA